MPPAIRALMAPVLAFIMSSSRGRIFSIILFNAGLVLLVLTFSRGAMLGLGLALVVIATVRYRPMLALLILGTAVFLLLPFTQDYLGHFLDAFTQSDLATQMRLGEYKDALTLISRYPLFGVGFGGAPDIDTYLGVSSVYLLMAEEMGLVGTVSILVLFFILTLVTIHIARRAPDLFGSLLTTGIISLIGLQALFNMAVTMGLVPTKDLMRRCCLSTLKNNSISQRSR